MITNYGIDINCDVGEGFINEAALMPFLSSCNIACGGHAGDTQSMLSAIKLAKKHHVKIGAHPSYPDKENFGRLSLTISRDYLINSIQNQLQTFVSIVKEENSTFNHIKPHGALYKFG